jgi:hypothetical protein
MAIYNVINRETRDHTVDRYITYDLKVELPSDWDDLDIDDKGIWLNENAEFIGDSFSDVELGDMEEVTIDIAEDELQGANTI